MKGRAANDWGEAPETVACTGRPQYCAPIPKAKHDGDIMFVGITAFLAPLELRRTMARMLHHLPRLVLISALFRLGAALGAANATLLVVPALRFKAWERRTVSSHPRAA